MTALGQTGVDDDRVSLPAGPGSIEGVGDDVELDPNMGSMTHSIPIRLPAGFPGATPSLTLNYSSAAPSGPLGIGWSMMVPMVGRMTSRGAPNYNVDDLFDANGAELVHVRNDNGDRIYRARFESSFVRYRWVRATSTNGDDYWVAEAPNGSLSYFGADAGGNPVNSARRRHPDGSGTAEYCLVATVDSFGNTVRYQYAPLDGTVPLLTQISWLDDGTGQDDIYSVEFDYASRPDLISDASRGFEEVTANRLNRVRVRHEQEIVREYALTYQDDRDAGGFSRLQRVEQYGVGGVDGGSRYPLVHSFDYSQALGVDCMGASCQRPYLVPMGNLPAAVNLAGGGFATLIDINADGLPDVLNTEGANHVFNINTLTPTGNGGFTHTFAPPVNSAVGNQSMRLGSGVVQIFDVNGDGRADLLDTADGRWLENGGNGDWTDVGQLDDVSALQGTAGNARFVDIDDDKRVDLLTSDSQGTVLFHNQGTRFVRSSAVMAIGVPFTEDFEFADMNGDGLNDPVELRSDGSVRYRLNLGRGNWGPWRDMTGPGLQLSERPFADLEDLNGDGIADLVVVAGTRIKYALNQNGDRFDAFVTITDQDIDGTLPERTPQTTLMYADMNGNGSEDIVWIATDGSVTYLELFPVRPNLLTRIDNGIGSVQVIGYTTAAEAAAEARAAGTPWTRSLSIPMQMVDRIDRYVTLTGNDDGSGLHEITTMTYRDGFYDGVEKQYRGFERVESVVTGDEFQERIETDYVFDVGRTLPHRNGLNLSTIITSGDRILRETINTYEDCTLDASVPAPAVLEGQGKRGVYFPCVTRTDVVHKEGLTDSASWKTVRTERQYNEYGSVSQLSELGVVGTDGDELYTLTDYVVPTTRWLLGLPSRSRVMNNLSNSDFSETLTYYDGTDFTGLPLGTATEGFVSRVTRKINANGDIIEARRARRTSEGLDKELITPNGSIGAADVHRATYTYDATGYFRTMVDLHLVDDQAQPYRLRQRITFERRFQRPIEMSRMMVVRDGNEETNPDSVRLRFDAFGRILQQSIEGDQPNTPSMVVDWQLGDPWSRVRIRTRSQQNGALDQEELICMDGKGRPYQTRQRIDGSNFQVSGFRAHNARGAAVQTWQPWVSSNADCEAAAPADVLSTRYRYDGTRRLIEVTTPGMRIYNEDVVNQMRFLPLAEERFDGADSTQSGEHTGTPTLTTFDGLGRMIAIQRTADDSGARTAAGNRMFYDSRGDFAGYETAAQQRHTLTRDLLGRIISVENPNLGTVNYTYDAGSNITGIVDARGVDQRRAYDGQNRLIARWDAANRDATLVTWQYDLAPQGCANTECTNVAGGLAGVSYPVPLLGGTVLRGNDRFGYDVQRRQVLAGRRIGSLVDLLSRDTVDNRERVVGRRSPDGTERTFVYDGKDRLTQVPGLIEGVAYEPRGLLQRITFANRAQIEYSFDDLMRLDRIAHRDGSGGVMHDLAVRRNRAGAVTDVQDSATSAVNPSVSVILDDWYRTTGVTYGGGTTSQLAFDDVDRVTSIDGAAVQYDATRTLAVSAFQGVNYTYDAAGHMTGRGNLTMTRDELGRIAKIARDGVDTGVHAYAGDQRVLQMNADGTLVLYGFNNFEVRDGVSTTYTNVGRDRAVREERLNLGPTIYGDGNANMMVDAGDAWLASQTGSSSLPTQHILAAAAARLLVEQESQVNYLHVDHLGSHIAATDADGAVRGQQAFAVFGTRRASEGYVGAYGFTGQEQDRTTGLIHMMYRDLDPLTGRWDRFDPAFVNVDVTTMSLLGEATTGYAYVANNPISHVDPSGLFIKKLMRKAGKAIKARNQRKARERMRRNDRPHVVKLRNNKSKGRVPRRGQQGRRVVARNPRKRAVAMSKQQQGVRRWNQLYQNRQYRDALVKDIKAALIMQHNQVTNGLAWTARQGEKGPQETIVIEAQGEAPAEREGEGRTRGNSDSSSVSSAPEGNPTTGGINQLAEGVEPNGVAEKIMAVAKFKVVL